MSVIDSVLNTVQTGRASTSYKVGSKSTGIPVDVKLSLDQDFKMTLLKGVGIFSLSVGAGIATGIVISNSKKRR